MTCHDAEPLIARYADADGPSLPGEARESLRAHLETCAACRTALDEQRETAALLRSRPAPGPRPGFVARVAARIDREEHAASRAGAGDDWFGAVNWRAWTVGVVPVAVALVLAAYLDIRSTLPAAGTQAAPVTIAEYLSTQAPAELQASSGGEALIEAVLTGAERAAGENDVR